MHLNKRGRDAAGFDLPKVAGASEGFSGPEIAQVIVAGRYTAFNAKQQWTTEILLLEIQGTRPFSVTRRGRGPVHSRVGEDPRRTRGLSVLRWELFDTCVGLLEATQHLVSIAGLFHQRFRVPLASRDSKKVATIDVDGAGKASDRISHRMDDVRPQRNRIFFAEGLRARGFELAGRVVRQPALEDIVFAAGVDANDRPHPVIVRKQGHPRCPDHIQDREIACPIEFLHLCSLRFAEGGKNGSAVGDRSGQYLANSRLGCAFPTRLFAVRDKLVEVKLHRRPPLKTGELREYCTPRSRLAERYPWPAGQANTSSFSSKERL